MPYEKWGKDNAKTLEHLLEEIESGEAELYINENLELMRKIRVANVDIFYEDESGKYYLVEDRQEFKDGRIRYRKELGELKSSIAEKIIKDESPEKAAIRALSEELNIKENLEIIPHGEPEEEVKKSTSYPGIKSKFTRYRFSVKLKKEYYNPEGYIEEQEDKTTFFVWQKIE